jgi:hypothetical protein
LNFEIVSDFGFRISNLASRGRGVSRLLQLRLDQVVADPDVQQRAGYDRDTVADYAEIYQDPAGPELPPVVCFFGPDDRLPAERQRPVYWLADGFQRRLGAEEAGIGVLTCQVHDGDRRAAILYATAANARHGLRRTNEDKRRAVLTLLRDPEWSEWSDREIARRTETSNTFVSLLRHEVSTLTDLPPDEANGEDGEEDGGQCDEEEASRLARRQELERTGRLLERALAKLDKLAVREDLVAAVKRVLEAIGREIEN